MRITLLLVVLGCSFVDFASASDATSEAPMFPPPCTRDLIFEKVMMGSSLKDAPFVNTFRQLMKLYPKDQRVFQPGIEVYMASAWSDDVLMEVSTHFEKAIEENGKRPLIETLLRLDKKTVAMLLGFDQWVRRLKSDNKLAVRIANSEHSRQSYGDFDHTYHLGQVRAVLKEFGYGPKDSVFGLILGTAARLHDLFEDTDVDRQTLDQLIHQLVLDIVEAVTKVDNLETQEANKLATIAKILSVREALPVKLADRIVNLRMILRNISRYEGAMLNRRLGQLARYVKEDEVYREKFDQQLFKPMWDELERLIAEAKDTLKRYESQRSGA